MGAELMMEPSEEILKALDEIVDVNLEEVGRRRIGKRSSILKQPRFDDDQTEDPQKGKSFTSKRRVSFADKFQVMELCTGNIYDIPGKSVSSTDSALSGDSKSVLEPDISNKTANNVYISRSEIKASIATEVVLTENEGNSLPFSKKHKISFDKNVEPESKKINFGENSSSLKQEDVFSHDENMMSEFKKFLFGNADVVNKKKDQNTDMNFLKNVATSLHGTDEDLQEKDFEKKLCDMTNTMKDLPRDESDKLTVSKYENLHVNYKCASITKSTVNDYNLKNEFSHKNKRSLDLTNQMIDGFLTDASKIEVLPISLSDVPLEENKENIFIDVRNKNVLVTNARDLKLKEQLPLKMSQVFKPHSVGFLVKKQNSFPVKNVSQDEIFNSVSIKEQDISYKENAKSFANKTCVLNQSMELTCFPSDKDLIDKVEHPTNDDYVEGYRAQSYKSHMDTSHCMDLTCNVQALTDSLSTAVSHNSDKDESKIGDAMNITCNDHTLADSSKNGSIRCNHQQSYKSHMDTSHCMDLTCNVQALTDSLSTAVSHNSDKDESKIGDAMNITCNDHTLADSSKNGSIRCNHQQSYKSHMDTSHCMDLTCNVQALTDSLSTAVSHNSDKDESKIGDAMNITCNDHTLADSYKNVSIRELSSKCTDFSHGEKRGNVDRSFKTQYFSSYGMDLTCDASNKNNLKIYNQPSNYPNLECKSLEVSLSNNAVKDFNKEVEQYKEISENSSLNLCSKKMHTIQPASVELEKVFNSTKAFEKTQIVCDEMDLTCYEKNNTSENDEVFFDMNAIPNTSFKDAQASKDKLGEEEYEIQQVKVDFGHNSDSLRSVKKLNLSKNEIENLSKTAHNADKVPKSLTSNRTHFFTSDYMEITSNTCSEESEPRKNAPVKSLSKTKHFSSFGMDLTCNSVSNVSSNLAKRRILSQDESFGEDNCITSEIPVIPPAKHQKLEFLYQSENPTIIKTDNFEADFEQNCQKTKYFSSYKMELTCDFQNENDSYILHYSNSPSEIVLNSKCPSNIDNKRYSIEASFNKFTENHSNEKYGFEKESRSLESSYMSKNLSVTIADKQLDYSSEMPNNLHSKQDVTIIEDVNDFQAQNVDEPDGPISSDFSLVQKVNNTNQSLTKRSKTSDNDHELDNKSKFSKSLEPGIVYAIKQVKDVNQALSNDYNIFKFPEIFFPLKRNLRPKTSFSCTKIELAKAVREAIRKSCSFSYASKEWSPEFSERDKSKENKKSVELCTKPIKINENSAIPALKFNHLSDVSNSPQILRTFKSRTKTVSKTVFVYPDIQIAENSPLPKTNESVNKDFGLRKDSFSISNASPDMCLRKSLDFDNEINSSRIVISHMSQESVIEKTAVVTAIGDSFPDDSKFCLDSSISLVPNDDTFGSVSLKMNSKMLYELNSVDYLNQSFDQLKKKSSKDIDDQNLPNDAIKSLTVNSPRLIKGCVLQEQITDESCKFSDNIPLPTVPQQGNKNNEVSLLDRYNMTLLKQKNNDSMQFSKNTLSEETSDNRNESNIKSLYPSNSISTENCNYVLEDQSLSKEKCIKTQVNQLPESLEKSEQTSNAETVQTISKVFSKQNETVNEEHNLVNCNEKFLWKNKECVPKTNATSTDKHPVQKETCDSVDGLCLPNSSILSNVNAVKICQNSSLEKLSQDGLTKASYKAVPIINGQHEGDSNDIILSNTSHNLKKQNDQTLDISSNVKQHPVLDNTKVLTKQELSKNLQSNEVLPLNLPADSTKQNIIPPMLSKNNKSPPKLNENEVTEVNLKGNCSDLNKADFIAKDSNCYDTNIEDSDALQDVSVNDNSCLENPFERIHALRKEIKDASERKICLWSLVEMDDKQAVFEILGDSLFASYTVCVDLKFTPESILCIKVFFMHSIKEPDDRDELGFLLFENLIANDINVFPFPVNELLNKLPKWTDFALSAKQLIQDVWLVATRNEISIDLDTPRLTITVLNENHFSIFNVSLPINITTYPDEKITPEITHLEHNLIKNEIILDVIDKVLPGERYLYRIAQAAIAL